MSDRWGGSLSHSIGSGTIDVLVSQADSLWGIVPAELGNDGMSVVIRLYRCVREHCGHVTYSHKVFCCVTGLLYTTQCGVLV